MLHNYIEFHFVEKPIQIDLMVQEIYFGDAQNENKKYNGNLMLIIIC